jgi:hypothetical protein
MTLEEQIKARYSPQEIRMLVLDQVWNSCNEDGDYLTNLIDWAHRDYKAEDYINDFISMDLDGCSSKFTKEIIE